MGDFGIGQSFAIEDGDNFEQCEFALAVFFELGGLLPAVVIAADFVIFDPSAELGLETGHGIFEGDALLEPAVKLGELVWSEILDFCNRFCFSHKN